MASSAAVSFSASSATSSAPSAADLAILQPSDPPTTMAAGSHSSAGPLQQSHHHQTRRRNPYALACAGCFAAPEQPTPWVRRGHFSVSFLHSFRLQRRRYHGDSTQSCLCGLGPARSSNFISVSLIVDAGRRGYDHVCKYICRGLDYY
jgi:hypothetical protein